MCLSGSLFVYMRLKDNKDLDLTLNVKVDELKYAVFASTNMIKCFGCGQMGHQEREEE